MNRGNAPDIAPTGRLREHEEAVLRALRRIIRAVDLYSRQLATSHDLTGPQLVCLRELSRRGLIASGQLADAVQLSQATLTGILDRLEERGLVRREKDASDRRRVLVGLTEPGRALLAQAPPPLQEAFLSRFGALSERQQAGIRRALERIVEMMEAEELDAAPMLASPGVLEEGGAGPDEGWRGRSARPAPGKGEEQDRRKRR